MISQLLEKIVNEAKTPKVSVKATKHTPLGDKYIVTVYSADDESKEIAQFEFIVHRQGGLYFERQISGDKAPLAGIKYVTDYVSKELNEPIGKD